MTPAELKSARADLRLSQTALGAALGATALRTIQHWEAGDSPIPGWVPLLLRLLVTARRQALREAVTKARTPYR